MPKLFLRFLNRLLSTTVRLVLVTAILYAGYALWDNHQIVKAAENPLVDMMPTITEDQTEEKQDVAAKEQTTVSTAGEESQHEKTDLGELFEKLKSVNSDIGAWITVPGTKINYAVVRGRSNIEYVSKDIYRNFAIAGSIFLDSRNKEDYSDTYNLLYGHNMTEHRMFSDVNLFKDETFFNENQKAYIYFPTGAHWLQTVSIILTNASDSWIMNPKSWDELSAERMLELVKKDAVFISEAGMQALEKKLEAEMQPHFVALSTCSNEFTDARTILLTLMDPDEVQEVER